MTEIRLHIDELVLHGFDPRQRHAIADAVQAELTRLLTDSLGELDSVKPISSADHRRVDAGAFTHAPDALPLEAGASLAAALHTAIQPLLASSSMESRDE
jgi:hypothetical protein